MAPQLLAAKIFGSGGFSPRRTRTLLRIDLNLAGFGGRIRFVGIVLKNAIVLMDFAIKAKPQGKHAHAAICAGGRRRCFFSKFGAEPVLDFLPRPRRFAQKRQAGFHRRIELETADGETPPQLAPTMPLNELIEDGFQRDAMQRITRMDGRRPRVLFGWRRHRRHIKARPARRQSGKDFEKV